MKSPKLPNLGLSWNEASNLELEDVFPMRIVCISTDVLVGARRVKTECDSNAFERYLVGLQR